MDEKSRAKVYEKFDRKKKKAKDLAPGRTGTNTVDAAGRENYVKPSHEGWKIERPPQKRTAPKHPGVMSYPTSKRPAGTADPGAGKHGLHLPKDNQRIRKLTVGFGKNKAGKSLGQTTIVGLGKNPSAAKKIKGAIMARNQMSKRGTAPQAKAPKAPAKRPTWWDKPAVEAKAPTAPKQATKSFSASGIAKALGTAGVITGLLVASAGTAMRQTSQSKVKPKRDKSAAVVAARTRKPVVAPKVKPVSPGAAAQASPKLKARSDTRRAAEGTKLRYAGYGQPAKVAAPKPERRTRPAGDPAAYNKVVDASTHRASDRAATTGQAEIAASKRAIKTQPAPIQTPVDPKAEGRVKRVVKAPGRIATKTAATVVSKAKDAVDPNIAETKAARSAIKTPVDPTPAEFEGQSPDQLVARKKELEAKLETNRARSGAAKAKQAKAKVSGPVVASPEKVEAVKEKDVARARTEADKIRTDIHKTEAQPNVKTEQKLETTPDERRQGEQRVGQQRSQATRQTQVGAKSESRARTIGPKQSTRRQKGSDRRGAPAIDTNLQKKLETARELNAKLLAKKAGTTYSGRPSRHDPAKEITPKPPVPQKAAPKPSIKPVKHPLGPDPAAVKNAEKYTAAARTRTATKTPVRLPERPLDAIGILAGKPSATLADAKVQAAELREVIDTAEKPSRNATTSGDTKVAASAADEAKRKKAVQKFYNERQKRIEAQGSVRRGTTTAVNPAVVGAKPVEVAVTAPPLPKRRPTEELIREQGVKVTKVPEQKAPETDVVTEEWDKKAKNAKATRTPLEQAKLNAKELGIQIAEAEARAGTLGKKIAEAARPGDTLTADMAEFKGKRILSTSLNNEGERVTTVLEGENLKQTVADANEDLRKGGDRRSGETTRRNFSTRSTLAEASELVTESDRAERPGEQKVGAKKGTRRDKQPGGDRRQKGSTWKPVDIGEELAKPENQRPGGMPDRRGPNLRDLNVGELKDSAARGDTLAKDTLDQLRSQIRGEKKERRAGDTAPREAATRINQLTHEIEGTGKVESTSTWDPKANRRIPNPQMDVEADLMPKVKVYSGDPIRANTIEKMDKRISDLEKRLAAPGAGKLHKGQETLEKLKRQRAGIAQDTNLPGARQFPRIESERAEGNVVPGEKRIPDVERRTFVRGEADRRDVPKRPRRASSTGTPDAAEGKQARRPAARRTGSPDLRTGTTTRPAPYLPTPKAAPRVQAPLTGPGIGSHVGEGVSKAFKAAIKSPKLRGGVGLGLGLGVGTAMFAIPDVASAFMDSPGDQRERVKATGEQALESGFQIGAGLALFSGIVAGVRKVAPKVLKPAVGGAAGIGGAAVAGYHAGAFAGDIYNRVKRVSDKNKREAEYNKLRYGSIEAATRTRKGLKADGKPMTLDDTEEIARRWERESKRPRAKE